MSRGFTIAVLVALTGLGISAPLALAAGDFPMGVKITPSINATIPSGNPTLTFSIPSSCPGLISFVEVAKDSQLDQDGTLLNTLAVDRFPVDDIGAGTYQGSTNANWLKTPGAYYWQISGTGACDGGNPILWVGSPIGITITPVVVPGDTTGAEIPDETALLTLAQARAAIPTIIKNVKKRIARGLKRRCTRGGGDLVAVFCTASWNDKLQYQYNGSFRMVLDDTGAVVSRFDGRRASLTCLHQRKGKGAKKCYRAQRFEYDL